MPPHCDSLDGPVVTAARRALEAGDVDIVLPFAWAEGEEEIRGAFEKTMEARKAGGTAAEVADRWFFETVVRVHRAGEGATFTGMKPAGLDHGPVIPLALKALESGDTGELATFIGGALKEELDRRLAEVNRLKDASEGKGVPEKRAYVSKMLGFQVYSHKTWKAILEGPGHK